VTVYGCSASISLRSQIPLGYHCSEYQVMPDEAHQLVARPYVAVTVVAVGAPPWGTLRVPMERVVVETSWSVHALGLVENEAYDAVEQALETLQADIAAGNIRKGTHGGRMARNPLEDPAERELRAYREQGLRELEQR
jgi:hypothetical protein